MRVFRSQKPNGRHEVASSAVTLYAKPIRPILDTLRSVIEYRSARGRRWCINNKRRSALVAVPGCVRTISWTRRQRWANLEKSSPPSVYQSATQHFRSVVQGIWRHSRPWNGAMKLSREKFSENDFTADILHKYGSNYKKKRKRLNCIKFLSLIDWSGPCRGEPVGDRYLS